MTRTLRPDIAELCARAETALTAGKELLGRNGPTFYIDLAMSVAADCARRRPYTYWDSGVAPRINAAESETEKYEFRRDVTEHLIEGYKTMIMACEDRMSWDGRRIAKRWYPERIEAYTERIRELEEYLEQSKEGSNGN